MWFKLIKNVNLAHLMVFSLLFAAITGFQNCSKVALRDLDPKKTTNSATAAAAEEDSGAEGIDQLISECEQAESTGKLSTQRITVEFPNPNKQCEWGIRSTFDPLSPLSNLTIKDKYIRARIEQIKSIQMPSDAKVCSIQMTNLDHQDFWYDDNIFVTLNGYILASTSNFNSHLTKKNGFYKYDWAALVDKAAQNSSSDSVLNKQYCASGDHCEFPVTDTYGSIQLNFSDGTIQNILGMTSANDIKLGFITTGDNDSSDCQHVTLRFAVDLHYK